MNWYSISVFYEGLRSSGGGENLWEEKIFLVQAASEALAVVASKELALTQEVDYRTDDDGVVRWTFRTVASVCAIDSAEISSGVEVFSRFITASEAESLLQAFD